MINIGLYAQTTKFRKQGDAFHAAGVRGHVDLAFELVGKKTFMEILQQTPIFHTNDEYRSSGCVYVRFKDRGDDVRSQAKLIPRLQIFSSHILEQKHHKVETEMLTSFMLDWIILSS